MGIAAETALLPACLPAPDVNDLKLPPLDVVGPAAGCLTIAPHPGEQGGGPHPCKNIWGQSLSPHQLGRVSAPALWKIQLHTELLFISLGVTLSALSQASPRPHQLLANHQQELR